MSTDRICLIFRQGRVLSGHWRPWCSLSSALAEAVAMCFQKQRHKSQQVIPPFTRCCCLSSCVSAFLSAFAGSHFGKNTVLAPIAAFQGIHTVSNRHHIARSCSTRCDSSYPGSRSSQQLHGLVSCTSQINWRGVAGPCWVSQAHECCCWWCSSALGTAVCCKSCTGRPRAISLHCKR